MSDRMKTDWNRYSKLNGDPLHLPTVLGVWKTLDVSLPVAATALGTTAAWYMGASNEQLVSMGLNGIGAVALYQAMGRFFDGLSLKRHFNDVSKYCIDKKPTNFTMKTKPSLMTSAEDLKGRAKFSMMFLAAITPLLYFDNFYEAAQAVSGPIEDVSKNGVFSSIFFMTWMLREGMTYARFNNVVKEKWSIVHPPAKPQKQENWLGKLVPGL